MFFFTLLLQAIYGGQDFKGLPRALGHSEWERSPGPATLFSPSLLSMSEPAGADS